MLKAKLSNGDYIFGIDAENVKRLKQKKPILIKGNEIGLGFDIFIMYGETLQELADELVTANLENMDGES